MRKSLFLAQYFIKGYHVKEKKSKSKVSEPEIRVPTLNKKIYFARFFQIFLLVLLFFVIFFVVKNFRYGFQQQKIKDNVQTLTKEITELKQDNGITDNLDVFSRTFVSTYYQTNISQDDYNQNLSGYFTKDMTVPTLDDNSPAKKILSLVLWSKNHREDNPSIYDVKYLVTYSINSKNLKELISFSVEKKGNQYSIVTYPYISNVPDLYSGNKSKLNADEPDTKPLEEKDYKEVINWTTKTFLPKYYSNSSLDEMGYMMKNSEVLGDSREFKGFSNIEVYKKGSVFIIIGEANLIESGTDKKEIQDLKIEVTQEQGKFVVQKLIHY